jgi:hypothetical protein
MARNVPSYFLVLDNLFNKTDVKIPDHFYRISFVGTTDLQIASPASASDECMQDLDSSFEDGVSRT